jgi:glycosyltransferase involved in cell wall biosynthesis
VPGYRAETTLERTVADIPAGIADRLIVVDDASPDNSVELARALASTCTFMWRTSATEESRKTSYTQALRSGADIVVLVHHDYEYEPKAVPLLIAAIVAGDAHMTLVRASRARRSNRQRDAGLPHGLPNGRWDPARGAARQMPPLG